MEKKGDDDMEAAMTTGAVKKPVANTTSKKQKKVKSPTKVKKRRKHKPNDFPKRPLSAYNIFFRETRIELLLRTNKTKLGRDPADKKGSSSKKSGNADETTASASGATDEGDKPTNSNVDYQSMVKEIAARWRTLDETTKKRVEGLAREDLVRYKKEVQAYEDAMVEKTRRERERLSLVTERKEQQEADELERNQELHARERRLMATTGVVEHRHQQHQSPSLQAVSSGGAAGEEPPSTAAERQLILEQELRNLEAARELKLRQLQLAQLQAAGAPLGRGGPPMAGGHPSDPSHVAGLMPAPGPGGGNQAAATSLHKSNSAAAYELEMLRARRTALMGSDIGMAGIGGYSGLLGGTAAALGLGGAVGGSSAMYHHLLGSHNPHDHGLLLRQQMMLEERGLATGHSLGAGVSGGIAGNSALMRLLDPSYQHRLLQQQHNSAVLSAARDGDPGLLEATNQQIVSTSQTEEGRRGLPTGETGEEEEHPAALLHRQRQQQLLQLLQQQPRHPPPSAASANLIPSAPGGASINHHLSNDALLLQQARLLAEERAQLSRLEATEKQHQQAKTGSSAFSVPSSNTESMANQPRSNHHQISSYLQDREQAMLLLMSGGRSGADGPLSSGVVQRAAAPPMHLATALSGVSGSGGGRGIVAAGTDAVPPHPSPGPEQFEDDDEGDQ